MRPPTKTQAYQTTDGRLFAEKAEAELHERFLHFSEVYNNWPLTNDDGDIILFASEVFEWLNSLPNFYWTFTQPPTEDTNK